MSRNHLFLCLLTGAWLTGCVSVANLPENSNLPTHGEDFEGELIGEIADGEHLGDFDEDSEGSLADADDYGEGDGHPSFDEVEPGDVDPGTIDTVAPPHEGSISAGGLEEEPDEDEDDLYDDSDEDGDDDDDGPGIIGDLTN